MTAAAFLGVCWLASVLCAFFGGQWWHARQFRERVEARETDTDARGAR